MIFERRQSRLLCSSPNKEILTLLRFATDNTMASDEVQPVTAQQPIEGELLNVLTMSKEQILNLISATHLPDEDNFDVDILLLAVEEILVYMFLPSFILFVRFSFSLFVLVRRCDIIIVEHSDLTRLFQEMRINGWDNVIF